MKIKTLQRIVMGLWAFVVVLNIYFKNIPAAFNAGMVVFVYYGYIRSEERTKKVLDAWKKSIAEIRREKK